MKIKTILIILLLHSNDIVEIKTDTWKDMRKKRKMLLKSQEIHVFSIPFYTNRLMGGQTDRQPEGQTDSQTDR